MSITIRPSTERDEAALSKICLLTADAGTSAEHLHDYPELPGLVYSVPYIKLPTTWAFVLEDSTIDPPEVVGYVIGSKDTRAYEKHATEHWWPALAEKYPPSIAKKEGDVRYTNLFRNMYTAPQGNIDFSPAHLHINILPAYQKRGFGTRLINRAVEHLKGEGIDGVWLGIDPLNKGAKAFYERIGFREIEGGNGCQLGLRFSDWRG